MTVLSLPCLLFPAVLLAPQDAGGHPDLAARLEALGQVPTVRHEGMLLERTHARAWKDLLRAVRRGDRELYDAFREAFQGALLAAGDEAGLSWSPSRRRLELHLPPAALDFARGEAGGLPAARCFLWRLLEARRRWQEAVGDREPGDPVRQAAALALHEPAAESALDHWLWDRRQALGLGVLPRQRHGDARDLEIDGSQGIPVAWGPVVLVGDPPWLARIREVLQGVRADPEAAALLAEGVEILCPAGSSFVAADWYFRGKEVGVRLGRQGAATPASILALGLRDSVRGRAVAVPGDPKLVLRELQANVVAMAAYWRLLRDPAGRVPEQAEIDAAMAAAREAFRKRKRAGG